MNQSPLYFYILCFLSSFINAQQNYSGSSTQVCKDNDQTGHSPSSLYTCNGQERSCQSFLLFISKPPYNSVPSISTLTSSNQEELARLNNVTKLSVFPTNKEVIVSLNCSCIGGHYQANTTFVVGVHETYYIVATQIYEGSTGCNSLRLTNGHDELNLLPGTELQVPLRCACPTKTQIEMGKKYLLSYLVSEGDHVSDIGKRLNVSTKSVLDANGFSEVDPVIFPFTTILVPLLTKPLSSQTIVRKDVTNTSHPSGRNRITNEPEKNLYVGIATKVGFFLLIIGIILLISIFVVYKKKQNDISRNNIKERSRWISLEDIRVEIARYEPVLKVYEHKEIMKATKKFSPGNRLNGVVYRGVFGKKAFAVKKTSVDDASKEVNMLKKINHFNVIKLEGVCENHGRFYLLFEYMEKGSLREWLNRRNSAERSSWRNRIQIALDVANGLHYLHSFTESAYVHNGIKSSNILLNSSLRAKISNFSLSRVAMREAIPTAAVTTNVVGTKGYMAPEYREAGLVSTKIDVYAFGVVILELITGKEAVIVEGGNEVLLSSAIVTAMEDEHVETELEKFVDDSLMEDRRMEFAMHMGKLGVACLAREPERRPSMGEIVSALLKIQETE